MRLCFTVDALAASSDKAWRLVEGGRWRPCTFAEDLRPGDARLTDRNEITDWIGRRLKRDRDAGLVAGGRPGMFDFLARGIFAHAVVHRLSPAPLPRAEQLAETLRALEPGRPWLVHLDPGGHYRALDSSRAPIIGNPDIAVRGEIASAPAYIGPEAAGDAHLVGGLHHQFLAGWLAHLESRRLGIFVPDPEKLRPEDEIRAAIEAWEPEAEPR